MHRVQGVQSLAQIALYRDDAATRPQARGRAMVGANRAVQPQRADDAQPSRVGVGVALGCRSRRGALGPCSAVNPSRVHYTAPGPARQHCAIVAAHRRSPAERARRHLLPSRCGGGAGTGWRGVWRGWRGWCGGGCERDLGHARATAAAGAGLLPRVFAASDHRPLALRHHAALRADGVGAGGVRGLRGLAGLFQPAIRDFA